MSTQMSEEKRKSLEAAMGQIEKAFGKGSIMRLNGDVQKMPSISTGSIKIDHALGIGGLPKGRIIEIYGPESSGKTTLTLQVAAECQKTGGIVAFVDAEHALDPSYAQKLGVNVEELLVSQPDTGEQALEIVDMLTRSGAVDLIIVDSVAALVPKAEIEGEMGDSHMGLQARLMSQALRKITGKVKDTNTTIIFINQLRMKIGVVFGNPETTTGGNALKFYASVRIDIRGTTPVKEGDVQVGKTVKVKIIKNKVSPPFKEAEVNLLFGSGIDKYGEVIDFAVEQGLLTKSGAWYGKTGVGNLAQGKANMRTWLIEHPEESDAIEHQVRVTLGLLEDVKPATKKNEKLDKADK